MLSRQVLNGTQCSINAFIVILVTVPGIPALSAGEVSEDNRPVPNVLEAFDNLTHHGEWLGFHNGPDGAERAPARSDIYSKNHIQGLARSPRPGIPYFFVCSSGAWSDSDGSDANLMVVEMGSRDRSGERLRSNRLLHGRQTSCTAPDERDRVVVNITFPNFRHPGGMQMVGDILVVPLEGGRDDTGFCDGGGNHGGSCSSGGGCPASCVGRVCEGGLNDGDPCTSIADCEGGGSCVGEAICQGGSNDGGECSDHLDCPSSTGICIFDKVCSGGSNDGEPCRTVADCEGGGTCVRERVCDGGTNEGKSCTGEADCDGGGICVSKTGACDGGSNDGGTCRYVTDCTDGGTCIGAGICDGGSNDRGTCHDITDCPDGGLCLNPSLPEARILFYDMSDPLYPKLVHILDLNYDEMPFDPDEVSKDHQNGPCRATMEAGFAGITKLPDDRFLLMIGWHAGQHVGFWRSNKTSFLEDGFKFEFHDYWSHPDLKGGLDPWPVGTAAHQNYSLVNQSAATGGEERIFMIGGRNRNVLAPVAPGEDVLALYEITGFEEGNEIIITQLREEKVVTFQNDSSFVDYYTLSTEVCSIPVADDVPLYPVELTNADLLAGGTTHITACGELLFYAVTHYNDGIVGAGGDRIVRMAELRHQHVVRDDSPAYESLADADGPYRVEEGGTIELRGDGSRPTLAAPWAHLYEHIGFSGQSVIFDYADRDLDDYDNFGRLDGDALLWPCLDLELLAEIMADGKQLVMDDIPAMGLTVNDFLLRQCVLFEVDGECWITPPIPQVKGHKICVEGVCGPCLPAIFGESLNCTLTPEIPGIPGFRGWFPDPQGRGWSVIPDLYDVVTGLSDVADTIENCGRLFGADLREPPAPPDLLDVLNPANYDENGDGIPDAVQDLEAFIDLFPTLGTDAVEAIVELADYCESLAEYIDELFTTIHGFNDRASSVRWYAPVGSDIVLYDKAGYEGAHLVLPGTGAVEAISNLGGVRLTNDDGSAGHPAHDRIRSVRFEGALFDSVLDSYAWDIISPVPPNPFVLHDPATPHPTFNAYAGDGPAEATVELVVVDSLGSTSVATANVTILNVAPTIDVIGPNRIIAEGETISLTPVTFSDPGIPDTHTATIDWGDSSPVSDGLVTQNLVSGGGQIDGSHTYGDNGIFVVVVTVTDDDGGIGSDSFTVEVSNRDPVPTLDTSSTTLFRAGPAFTGRVGAEQLHGASASDTGSDDLRFVWSATEEVTGDLIAIRQADYFNNTHDPDPYPSGPGVFPFEAADEAAALFGRPGVYLLTLSVSDDDDGNSEASLPKLVTGDSNRVRAFGDWRQDFAQQNNNSMGDLALTGLLSFVNFASSYFSEQAPAAGLEEALAILRPGGADVGDPGHANIRGKAVQSVFSTWLNVASGALDLQGVTADDRTVLESLYAAEDILADASSTQRDLLVIIQMMNRISR